MSDPLPVVTDLRHNLEARLEYLGVPLSDLCRDAGIHHRRFYPLVSGDPKSILLRTLDEIAIVLRTAPWLLIDPDTYSMGPEITDQQFNSSRLMIDRMNWAVIDRRLKYDVKQRRLDSHNLRTLSVVADLSSYNPHGMIDPVDPHAFLVVI